MKCGPGRSVGKRSQLMAWWYFLAKASLTMPLNSQAMRTRIFSPPTVYDRSCSGTSYR
jgi:hypothetical protein